MDFTRGYSSLGRIFFFFFEGYLSGALQLEGSSDHLLLKGSFSLMLSTLFVFITNHITVIGSTLSSVQKDGPKLGKQQGCLSVPSFLLVPRSCLCIE